MPTRSKKSAPKSQAEKKEEVPPKVTSSNITSVDKKSDMKVEVSNTSLYITLFTKGDICLDKATQWANIIVQADDKIKPDDFCNLYQDSQHGVQNGDEVFSSILESEFHLEKGYDRIMMMGAIRRVLSKKRNKGKWSVEEEDLLEDALKEYGENWMKLASIVKTRNAIQVKNQLAINCN